MHGGTRVRSGRVLTVAVVSALGWWLSCQVPYRLGFSHPIQLWSAFFWIDLFVDLYFIADIFVSLRTAYHTERGELVVEERTIRRHYLKTWFTIGEWPPCLPAASRPPSHHPMPCRPNRPT
jgi:hypothetical protein